MPRDTSSSDTEFGETALERQAKARKEKDKAFRHCAAKLPCNRNESDLSAITARLMSSAHLTQKFSPVILRRLAEVGLHEYISRPDMTVEFADSFLYVIKGSVVVTRAVPLAKVSSVVFFNDQERVTQSLHTTVGAGDVFGQLHGVWPEITEAETREACEFLRFRITDYEQIVSVKVNMLILRCSLALQIARIADEKFQEKFNALVKNENFAKWPKKSLGRCDGSILAPPTDPLTNSLASFTRWVKVPEGEVIFTQGSRAPYFGFIQSGTCNVLRNATSTLATFPKVRTQRKHPTAHSLTRSKERGGGSSRACRYIGGDRLLWRAEPAEPGLQRGIHARCRN